MRGHYKVPLKDVEEIKDFIQKHTQTEFVHLPHNNAGSNYEPAFYYKKAGYKNIKE